MRFLERDSTRNRKLWKWARKNGGKDGNCVFLTAENAYKIRFLRIGQKMRAKIDNAIHKQK